MEGQDVSESRKGLKIFLGGQGKIMCHPLHCVQKVVDVSQINGDGKESL